jgi:hypothetical protein
LEWFRRTITYSFLDTIPGLSYCMQNEVYQTLPTRRIFEREVEEDTASPEKLLWRRVRKFQSLVRN